MGTQGVPNNLSKTAITSSLKENKGRITYAARQLNVAHCTLRKRINEDPELVELLSQLRHEYEENLLDSAENTLDVSVNKHEDMQSALKATFFILNNKGKSRGYTGQVGSSSIPYENLINDLASLCRQNPSEISRISESIRSPMATSQPLPHQGCRGQEDQIQPELGAESPPCKSSPLQDNTES